MRKTKKDYAVGYGKPPVQGQFKKGTSGNPKGRPKSETNSLISVLDKALNQIVTVKEGGIMRRIKKQEAWLIQLVNQAAAGDLGASRMLLKAIPLIEGKREEARRGAVDKAGLTARDRVRKKMQELRERLIASGRIDQCDEESE